MVAPVPYGLTGLRRTPGINPGAGLQYRPMNPWRSAAAGGLQGLGGLLMALGSGQPQQAMPAFQAGLQGQQDMEERRRQTARDEEVFGLKRQELADAAIERQSKMQAEQESAAAFDAAVDGLVAKGVIDAAQGQAMKAGVMKYGDVVQKPKGPQSEFGRMQADVDAGIVSPQTYEKWVADQLRPPQGPVTWTDIRDETGNVIGQRSSTGQLEYFDKGGSGPKPPSPKELRDEYTKATKEYEQAAYGYSKVIASANEPSGAGDVALIFGFMKTIDPTSTVREGEFATAQQTAGIPGQIVALYNRALNGERLTPAQRADFAKQAKNQFAIYEQKRKVADEFYAGLAERNQISPQDVLVPFPALPTYNPPVVPDPAFQQYQNKYGHGAN
jgi:hypothetical protein